MSASLPPILASAFSVTCWIVVAVCVLGGFAGCFVPLLPGTPLILAGVVVYKCFLEAPERPLSNWMLWGLVGIVVISHFIDFAAALIGANRYGASKAGVYGGLIGMLVGLFFGLLGMLFGPLLGVVAGEIYSGKKLPAALRAAWGTLVGNAAGIVGRVVAGGAMVVWFVAAVWG